MSTKMLDLVIDSNHIDAIPADDVDQVKAMILAGHGGGTPPAAAGRQWLHEIVANGRNGIDVDKVGAE